MNILFAKTRWLRNIFMKNQYYGPGIGQLAAFFCYLAHVTFSNRNVLTFISVEFYHVDRKMLYFSIALNSKHNIHPYRYN
jgi:hypothetical protein